MIKHYIFKLPLVEVAVHTLKLAPGPGFSLIQLEKVLNKKCSIKDSDAQYRIKGPGGSSDTNLKAGSIPSTDRPGDEK